MARFQSLPAELFDDIHKHCDPKSRLNLLQVSREFYDLFIQPHLKHVRLTGSQKDVSVSLARLLDEDNQGHTKKNRRRIQTVSILLKPPFDLEFSWEFYDGNSLWEDLVDDALIPRIVELTVQAKGLKFLRLQFAPLTDAQDEKFSQMLKETDKWTIQTLEIGSSVENTLACLEKCDPMQSTGVSFLTSARQSHDSLLGGEGGRGLTQEYKALKAFYEKGNNSKDEGPLLKRLSIQHERDIWNLVPMLQVEETLDEVISITKDFPDLEWLIVRGREPGSVKSPYTEHESLAWEANVEHFIAKLKETKLMKLSFFIYSSQPQRLLRRDERRKPTRTEIIEWYLRLAHRLVESVESLKEVAIMAKGSVYYRATQSENGKIKAQSMTKRKQTRYQFPEGLLDTWA
ncbi:hypothetical protein ACHAQD_001010 [Fusarium lateritium]